MTIEQYTSIKNRLARINKLYDRIDKDQREMLEHLVYLTTTVEPLHKEALSERHRAQCTKAENTKLRELLKQHNIQYWGKED